MKNILRLAAFAAISLVAWGADMATNVFPQSFSATLDIDTVAIPTSQTDVVSKTVYVSQLVLIVATGTTVTVNDKQGSPIPMYPAIVTTSGTVYFMPPGLLWRAKGGFTVQASGAGAYLYCTYKVP